MVALMDVNTTVPVVNGGGVGGSVAANEKGLRVLKLQRLKSMTLDLTLTS